MLTVMLMLLAHSLCWNHTQHVRIQKYFFFIFCAQKCVFRKKKNANKLEDIMCPLFIYDYGNNSRIQNRTERGNCKRKNGTENKWTKNNNYFSYRLDLLLVHYCYDCGDVMVLLFFFFFQNWKEIQTMYFVVVQQTLHPVERMVHGERENSFLICDCIVKCESM